jgi:hypothetical protein
MGEGGQRRRLITLRARPVARYWRTEPNGQRLGQEREETHSHVGVLADNFVESRSRNRKDFSRDDGNRVCRPRVVIQECHVSRRFEAR